MPRSAAAAASREEEEEEEMSTADDPYSDSARDDGDEEEVEEEEYDDEEEVGLEEEEEEVVEEEVEEEEEVMEVMEEDEDEEEEEEEVDKHEEGNKGDEEEEVEEQGEGNKGDEEEEDDQEEDDEEDEEEGQEEGGGEEEKEGEGSDFSDSSASMDMDAKDIGQKIESPTPKEFEMNPKLNAHVADHSSEVPCVNDRDFKPAVLNKHVVSSESNGILESFVDNEDMEDLSEKETFNKFQNDAQNDSGEEHTDRQSQYFNVSDSFGAENTKSVHFNGGELIKQTITEKGSGNGESDVNICKGDLQGTDTKLTASSLNYPLQRPRSPSADATLENHNKRPAIVCDFFARGWCIKGNSCRFLHQKDGVDATSQCTVEDQAGPSLKELQDETGLKHEVERYSALEESPDSPNAENSSKSQLFLQRALVRAYGGESRGLHHMLPSVQREKLHLGIMSRNESVRTTTINSDLHLDTYNMHTSPKSGEELYRGKITGSGGPFNPLLNEIHQTSIVQEEYNLPYGVHASRSPLIAKSSIPESRYSVSGSSIGSSMYQISNNAFTYDKSIADPTVLKQQSQFSLHDSSTSFSLNSPLNSSFTNSLLPLRISPSIHALAQPVTSSTHGSPLSAEHLDTHRTFDGDRGYYGSRSASLPRSSSPYFSRPEPVNIPLHNIAENLSASTGNKTRFQANSWEPSVPFRSSFYCPPASMSSPGSEYDPLLDSIETPIGVNRTLQASQKTSVQSMSSQHTNADPVLRGSQSSGYKAVSALGSCTVDGTNDGSMPREKPLSPDHVVDVSNVLEVDLNSNPISQADKGRYNKESKVSKTFRAALVEFVKELVKPAWREGNLSKDAHKMIVKKAVEKVLSALQTHQIPSTTESINQYLSSSRPKLLKLVEGYVEKYAKS